MLLKDIVTTCDKMGKLGVAEEVYNDQWYFIEDPVCVQATFCCNLVLRRLYETFGKGAEFCEFRDWFDDVPLPTSEISFETFCHGVLAEYFLQTQDFVCCKAWNDRFESALAELRLKRGGNLPVGRWI